MPPTPGVKAPLPREILPDLLALVGEINGVLDLDELLQRLAEIVKRVIDYEMFGILLLDEERDELVLRKAVNFGTARERSRIAVTDGLCGAAVRSREPVLVGDVRKDPRYVSLVPETRSELVVPLLHKDRVIGTALPGTANRPGHQACALPGGLPLGGRPRSTRPSPRARSARKGRCGRFVQGRPRRGEAGRSMGPRGSSGGLRPMLVSPPRSLGRSSCRTLGTSSETRSPLTMSRSSPSMCSNGWTWRNLPWGDRDHTGPRGGRYTGSFDRAS